MSKITYDELPPSDGVLESNDHDFQGRWKMVTVVRKNDTSMIYIDANLDVQENQSEVYSGSDVHFGAIGVRFENGQIYQPGYNMEDGKIDDIRIYNRALTEAEINALYDYNPVFDITPRYVNIERTGGTDTLSINNLGSGTLQWSAMENAHWLSLDKYAATGNAETVVLNADPNNTIAKRSKIIFHDTNAVYPTDTVIITQDGITQSVFFDDFNDNSIDTLKWTTQNVRVVEEDSIMKVECAATDNGGFLQSKWIDINTIDTIILTKTTKVHYANQNHLGYTKICFENNPQHTISIYYGNMDYNSGNYRAVHGIEITRNNAWAHIDDNISNISATIPAIWDTWFEEKVVYDPVSGMLNYYIDGSNEINFNVGSVAHLPNTRIRIEGSAWGWNTGHYHYMDDVDIRAGSPVQEAPILNCQPDLLSIDANEHSDSILITNTGADQMNWIAQVVPADTSWISITNGNSGTNTGTVNIHNEANTGAPRTGVIEISAAGAYNSPDTVQIFQQRYFPAGWSIDPNTWSDSALIIATVLSDDSLTGSAHDLLAAFSGTTCRAVIWGQPHATDGYYFPLMSYGQSAGGETLSFKFYEAATGNIYDLDETVTFVPDVAIGTYADPFELHYYSTRTINIPWVAGWNWFSMNVWANNMTLNSVLSSLSAVPGDYIKSQSAFAEYWDANNGWFGNLSEIDPVNLYMIKLLSDDTLQFTGWPIDILTTSMPLNQGWTWIGYLPQEPIEINSALSSLNPVAGDYIKSQTAFAEYWDANWGWFGSLDSLEPFKGYKIKMGQSDTLWYPEYGNSRSGRFHHYATTHSFTHGSTNWLIDPNSWEYNATITAVVQLGDQLIGSDEDFLAAFVGDECRGLANGLEVPGKNQCIFPLMVHSNMIDGEPMIFKYYDASNDQFYSIEESVEFAADMVLGKHPDFFVMHIQSTVGVNEHTKNDLSVLNVHPNPFKSSVTISYSIDQPGDVCISVYNPLDGKIEILKEQWHPEGMHSLQWNAKNKTSGVYFIHLNSDTHSATQKVILIR